MSSAPYYAIGDIHGCAQELSILLNKLPIKPGTRLIFLGDYIDRGPSSRQVVDLILSLRGTYDVITLMGNHEWLLLNYLDDPNSEVGATFIYNGGSATLASYADDTGAYNIPVAHQQFFQSLAVYHEESDYFFVHAGVPDVPLAKLDIGRDLMDMLWIREPFFHSSFSWEKPIVHGHTPVTAVEQTSRRINLDTGCVFKQRLTAMEFPSRRIFSAERQDEFRHTYLRDLESQRVATRFEGRITVTISKENTSLYFETLNYSEFGVFVREMPVATGYVLREGETVIGEIGTGPSAVWFSGTVVRRSNAGNDYFYAIQFLTIHPADFHQIDLSAG